MKNKESQGKIMEVNVTEGNTTEVKTIKYMISQGNRR